LAARDLAAWLDWQERLHPTEIELGLERVRAVLRAMALDRPPFRVATVGGTNGKGSCVAMLEALALVDGMATGAYTSPHLLRYNERVRVGGEDVSDAELVAAFEAVEAARGRTSLSYFEFGTAAALEIFRRREVSLAVLEVGMGGRLDAVNAVDPEVAVVTSVGLDHVEWLGPDRESIGREKGGIFRSGRPAIIGDRDPPASLLRAAGADALRLGMDFDWRDEDAGWRWRSAALELPGIPRGPCRRRRCATTRPAPSRHTTRCAPWRTRPGCRPPPWGACASPDACSASRGGRVVARCRAQSRRRGGAGGRAARRAGARADDRGGRHAGRQGCRGVRRGAGSRRRSLDRRIPAAAARARGARPSRGVSPRAFARRSRRPARWRRAVPARALARPGDRVVVCGSFHAVGPALEWLGVYCAPRTD
jgi:dihydrofolate synthase / folylpolyglutamate synthase